MADRQKFRPSLLRELSVMMFGVIALVFGFNGYQDYRHSRDLLIDSMRVDVERSLSRLTATVAPSMEAFAQHEYDKLVDSEIRLLNHLAIVIYDYRLGELIGEGPYVSGRYRHADGQLYRFDGDDAQHLQLLQNAFIEESAPILSSRGQQIGLVRVAVGRERLQANQREAFRDTVVETVLTAGILGLLLMLGIHRHLLLPMRELAQTLHERDSSGIPTKGIPDFGYRELTVLTDTMEDMVAGVRESHEALDLEHQRLENVIACSETGVWEWNVEAGKLRVNELWARFIGYSLDELNPVSIETWEELTHSEDVAKAREKLQQHFSGEEQYYDCEFRMRHKEGHWVWIQARGKVVTRHDNGKPRLMLGTHQDISGKKRQAMILEASEARFRGFFEQNLSVMLLVNPVNGKIEAANSSAESYYGYGAGALVGMSLGQINVLVPNRVASARQRTIEQGRAYFHFRHRLAGGEIRDVEVYSTPIEVNNKTLLFSIIHDITDRIRSEQRLRLSGSVFTHAREGIMITDSESRIVEVNESFTRITGYERDEALGRDPKFLSSGRQDRAFYKDMWRQLEEKDHWYGEVWNRRRDGEPYAELLTISTVRDDAGEVQNYVALLSDITTLKQNEQELERIAHFDALTGLPNRLLFGDRLRHAISAQSRRGDFLGVLFLDLDGFKAVNDEYGHETGDELLITLSHRMRESIRGEDTLARIGGDEFVAVLEHLPDRDDYRPVIRRLLESVAKPVVIAGNTVQVSVSIGLTFFPQGQDVDADQLVRQADQAMYQAKISGKNRYHVFDTAYDEQMRGKLRQLERIQAALEKDEFVLLYQPKVNMRSGKLIGVEALIRWQHPQQGLLAPAEFLPVIEGDPLMVEIGEWTLNQALAQVVAWRAQGIDTRVSVNIAAAHLQREDFLARLQAILAAHPEVQASQLELEIVETTAVENFEHVLAVIEGCQDLGITLALDDFGTGYSSLTYLRRLPAEVLKIDRSFVRDMQDDPEDLTILDGVISLARAFERDVLAEGVETEAHGEMLLWLGCQLGQGYGIARPMPANELEAWLEHWRAPARWRQASAISRNRVPVIFALVQHRSWIAALEGYLDGDSDAAPQLDPHECRLGRWLDACSALPPEVLAAVTKAHDAVHDAGHALLGRQGHMQGAELEALRRDLHRRRDALIEQLLVLAHGPSGGHPQNETHVEPDRFGGLR